ncbi:MAG: hypothetical protein ABIH38_05310 [Patescibacteria group bacterium]
MRLDIVGISLGCALLISLAANFFQAKRNRLERRISQSLREEVIALSRELKERDHFCSLCQNAIAIEEILFSTEEEEWTEEIDEKRAIEN